MFCERVICNVPATLTIVGATGTAKSHCLIRVLGFLRVTAIWAWTHGYWKQPMKVSGMDWSMLAESDRDDGDQTMLEALECDVLLLDDIGTEIDRFKTKEPQERLRQLLGLREKKHNLITTNIPETKWAEVWDTRVADRLLRNDARTCLLHGIPPYSNIA